jgi:NodT family efflux transporter outer membrane factor (OMF) lipoprotein
MAPHSAPSRTQRTRPSGPGLIAAAAALAFAGCAVGPNYHRPAAPVPAAFKEVEGWKAAAPSDAVDRGAWWTFLGDPVLNDLEAQVDVSNQTLLQDKANYQAARQIARSDQAGLFPTLSAAGSADKSKAAPRSSPTGSTSPATTFSASLQAAWEPDLWGKVRRQTEADVSSAQAQAALVASARLSLQAALAQDYISLRVLDANVRLLQNSIDDYLHSLSITKNKYAVGVAARSDVIEAETQVDSTRAQLIAVGVQRAQMEHAIAVLIGRAPGDFTVEVQPSLTLAVAQVPAQLPSTLLERRPDVAEAERAVAAANARIGVATAAYFPDLSLSAQGGFEGYPLHRLFTTPTEFWSLGSQLADTLFDAGQRHDLVLEARANYDASVANYRQVVLSALQQVEDSLASLGILAQEADVQSAAVAEATQAAQIAVNEYNAGTVDYTTVVTAQVTELSNRETQLGILETRLNSSVTLMTALGGGWNQDNLPDRGAVLH